MWINIHFIAFLLSNFTYFYVMFYFTGFSRFVLVISTIVVMYVKNNNTQYKRGTKDTKGTVKLINLKQTDNAMAKNEKDKQTTTHMTQHRKLTNKQHEPHQKTRGDIN